MYDSEVEGDEGEDGNEEDEREGMLVLGDQIQLWDEETMTPAVLLAALPAQVTLVPEISINYSLIANIYSTYF